MVKFGAVHSPPMKNVPMGEIAIASKGERLGCIGLGSCLALIVQDPSTGVSGLAHIMLPRPLGSDPQAPAAKYASEAVRHLAVTLAESGADIDEIRTVIVGGAQLIPGLRAESSRLPQLGLRNIEETKLSLMAFGLPIVAEEVGGVLGRTVTFDSKTGEVFVRSTASGLQLLCNIRSATCLS